MRSRAVALLDAIAEESWLTWARRHNLMPETEAERVRAVQAEEERQRRAELRRQEETRRAEAAARQRATSSQTGRTSRQASGRRPRVESVGEDVDMLSDAGLTTQGKGQGKGSAVKDVELKENPFLVRRYAVFVLSLLTFH